MLTFLTRSKIGVDFDGKIDASISQDESFLFFLSNISSNFEI